MTKLSLEQAIRNAIEVEEAAARFYKLLADSTADVKAKKFLEKMIAEEQGHARAIEDMGKELTNGKIPGRPDDNCEIVETAPEWAYMDDISYGQALEIALDAENHAALYYSAVADGFTGPVSEFFRSLSSTEEQHIKNLQETIKTLKKGINK